MSWRERDCNDLERNEEGKREKKDRRKLESRHGASPQLLEWMHLSVEVHKTGDAESGGGNGYGGLVRAGETVVAAAVVVLV